MNEPEKYKASEHPLGRIRECGLDKYFRRENSVIVCPLCATMLHVYVHKTTGDRCFFLCSNCAWFHARPVLFDLLKKAEQPGWVPPNHAAIGKTLDKISRSVLPAVLRNKRFYENLSGGKRNK